MIRSPFLFFILFLFLFSCEKKNNPESPKVNLKEEAFRLREKGSSDFQNKNFNTAFYNFNKSKIIYESLNDNQNIVYVLIQMAWIQQINGDFYGSKETLTEALPHLQKKDIYSASINNYFGIADKELSLYNDALFYYNEAIKDVKDDVSKLSPLNNIAVIYIQQKKYDKAIAILESILKQNEITNSSKARVLDNLGFAYFKTGLSEKGLSLMNEGLKLRMQSNDSYACIGSYLHLAEFYTNSNIQKSNEYAQKAYETSTKFNSVDERLKALAILISNEAGAKYGQKYISINDSIIKIRNNFKNKFAKIKYDSKKEKDENQKLKLEKAENLVALKDAENQKIIFISAFIIALFSMAYLKKHLDNRNREEKIKTAYDTETRIAKDIHDELANDVFNTITYTQTQLLTNENNKETLLQKLDHIYSRVRGISRENNDIDTGANYLKNLKEMLSTYNSPQTNVIINNIEKVNWDSIEDVKKIAIHRVLHELMVNMKKHSEALIVVIKFESTSNNFIINYFDNGKGCEKSKIIKNGLQNMENRISAIKGTLTFDTEPNKGFKVKISMLK